MRLKEVTKLDDIKKDDKLIITGDSLDREMVKAQIVKVTGTDGVEVIFDKRKNKYFNVGMYLADKSWVKEVVIVTD